MKAFLHQIEDISLAIGWFIDLKQNNVLKDAFYTGGRKNSVQELLFWLST